MSTHTFSIPIFKNNAINLPTLEDLQYLQQLQGLEDLKQKLKPRKLTIPENIDDSYVHIISEDDNLGVMGYILIDEKNAVPTKVAELNAGPGLVQEIDFTQTGANGIQVKVNQGLGWTHGGSVLHHITSELNYIFDRCTRHKTKKV